MSKSSIILDVDFAYESYCVTHERISKAQFLKKIELSPQTANNYQNALSRQKVLTAAYNIKDVTGLKLEQIIKPKNN